MPIKSKAQRRKFAELLVEGKISPETFEEWNRGAGSKELPERVHPKAVTKSKRKVKSTRKSNSTRKATSKRVLKSSSRKSKVVRRPTRKRA